MAFIINCMLTILKSESPLVYPTLSPPVCESLHILTHIELYIKRNQFYSMEIKNSNRIIVKFQFKIVLLLVREEQEEGFD